MSKEKNDDGAGGCGCLFIFLMLVTIILGENFGITGWKNFGITLAFAILGIVLWFLLMLYTDKNENSVNDRISSTVSKSVDNNSLHKNESEININVRRDKKVNIKKKVHSKEIFNSKNEQIQEQPFLEETKSSYFNGYEDLYDITDNPILELHYIRELNNYNKMDLAGLIDLNDDVETKKYFPTFYGNDGLKGLVKYVKNTTQVTPLGLAFAYYMKAYGISTIGIVKVTTPAHNRITNNFNHWMIDFIVTPENRRKGFASYSIKHILGVVEKMGAKEIFAMVDCENIGSMKTLEKCGFFKSELLDIGKNVHTGNKCILYRKIFETI